MLTNLRRIHKPETLDQAAELLKQPGVYPIYGSGAALIRTDSQDVEEAVDLTGVVGAGCNVGKSSTLIDGCAILETIASSDETMGNILREDAPETLRNAITLCDLLM